MSKVKIVTNCCDDDVDDDDDIASFDLIVSIMQDVLLQDY